MIDREKVLAVLQKRFPGRQPTRWRRRRTRLSGWADEWLDVTARQPDLNYCASVHCAETCFIADQRQLGFEFRILMKRPAEQ